MTADKVDFRRTIDAYRARAQLELVEVPDLQYLAVDGRGDPNTSVFAEAVEALYPVAYTLKFASKDLGRDYVVMPLEGLWWADDMDTFTAARDKSRWSWTLLIMVPDWIDDGLFRSAVEKVASKKKAPARLHELRLETLSEGLCVQVLHVGSYDDEADVLRRLHEEFVPGNGLTMTGLHHEIYLNDRRRVAPEKLRTILRQPVRRA